MEKEKILDTIEQEALTILKNFKEYPIRSTITAVVVLWGVKTIVNWMKGK